MEKARNEEEKSCYKGGTVVTTEKFWLKHEKNDFKGRVEGGGNTEPASWN